MAPILSVQSIAASAYAPAPHTLKQQLSTTTPEPVTATPPPPQCQICFDDLAEGSSDAIQSFCSRQCPAMLCKGCVAEHIRVAVSAAFPGVLPKVRCPICLVPMNKTKWEHLVPSGVVETYANACKTACGYRSPCCHDTSYTQLPLAFDAKHPSNYRRPPPLMLVPSLKEKLDSLRQLTRKFSNHKRPSRVVISYLEDAFGRHVPLATQHLIMEHLLPRIMDEERRATLLLSYHAKYKTVSTRCCGYNVCFNCKRLVSNHKGGEGGPCDDGELDDACIVTCRSCHVTMVKVEGCDAVVCWCGFSMSWNHEVDLRDRHKKGMIPVDVLDLDTYNAWDMWRVSLKRFLTQEVFAVQRALRLSRIDQALKAKGPLYTGLKTALQCYVWRHRRKRALPQLKEELRQRAMETMAKRLRACPQVTVGLSRWVWKLRFNKVVAAVRSNQFWLGYFNEHPVEQAELRAEEMAMLLPGLRK